jgi:hypothetical protein
VKLHRPGFGLPSFPNLRGERAVHLRVALLAARDDRWRALSCGTGWPLAESRGPGAAASQNRLTLKRYARV